TRWAMPEYMISGDASNANFASTIEAGTPFFNNVQSLQASFGKFQSDAIWKAVHHAWRAGVLDSFGLTWQQVLYLIEITATPPPIKVDDPLPETQRREILVAQGVMSKRRWAGEEGLD